MADRQGESEIVAVIVAAIEKHAQGDVERLARGWSSCTAPASRFAKEGSRLRGSGMRPSGAAHKCATLAASEGITIPRREAQQRGPECD